MRRPGARTGAALAAALGIALAGAACGKKAPLRLPDQIKAEEAPALRAGVRGGAVTVRFRVPARRIFPEREEPWVLARLLRREGPAGETVEAGAVLDTAGLAYGEELALVDEGRAAGVEHAYRVEFRDERRRRRALSPELAVSWPTVPGAPRALAAAGTAGAVTLAWEPPEAAPAGLRYRVYRREAGGEAAELPGAEVATPEFVDSRVRPGLEYCYEVRGVVEGVGAAVEGPAGAGACAVPGGALPPPAPEGLAVRPVGREFQLSWEPVTAPGVAGYAVYRAVGDAPPQRVTRAPVAGTLFVDDPGEVPPGSVVRWAVTAVGQGPRGGESAMSAPAAATVGAR